MRTGWGSSARTPTSPTSPTTRPCSPASSGSACGRSPEGTASRPPAPLGSRWFRVPMQVGADRPVHLRRQLGQPVLGPHVLGHLGEDLPRAAVELGGAARDHLSAPEPLHRSSL